MSNKSFGRWGSFRSASVSWNLIFSYNSNSLEKFRVISWNLFLKLQMMEKFPVSFPSPTPLILTAARGHKGMGCLTLKSWSGSTVGPSYPLVPHWRIQPTSWWKIFWKKIFTKFKKTKLELAALSHLFAAAAAKSPQSCPTLRPQRRQPNRLPRPWDSPGKNTGVGCHFPLQCMKVKSKSQVTQSSPTLSDPMDCSLPGSSVHGVFQARVLEWGAIAFSGHRFTSIYIALTLF